MAERFQSNALWPDTLRGVSAYGDCISTDTHDNPKAAYWACRGLEIHGFGGDGKVFPLRTWVSDVQQPPVIPAEWPIKGMRRPVVRASLPTPPSHEGESNAD